MTRKHTINDNQLSLPFSQARELTASLENREKAFWTLVFISLASLAIYIYAINAAAHHIAVRQNLEREVAEQNAALSSLEFAVIELKNNVTIETAREFGFSEVKKPLYVSRDTESSLTLNTAR